MCIADFPLFFGCGGAGVLDWSGGEKRASFFIPLPLTRASPVRVREIKNARPKAGHC